jgi:hypothetical protein
MARLDDATVWVWRVTNDYPYQRPGKSNLHRGDEFEATEAQVGNQMFKVGKVRRVSPPAAAVPPRKVEPEPKAKEPEEEQPETAPDQPPRRRPGRPRKNRTRAMFGPPQSGGA